MSQTRRFLGVSFSVMKHVRRKNGREVGIYHIDIEKRNCAFLLLLKMKEM
jgi:hypothetical protein